MITRKTELQIKCKSKKEFKSYFKLRDNVNDTPEGQSIYGSMERGKAIKEEYVFHTWFKYKLLEPFLLILNKIFDKHITVDLSGRHNKNLKIFNESWDEALKIWTTDFIAFQNGKIIKYTPKQLKKQLKTPTQTMFKTIKKFALWVMFKDTVVREFGNIWMHCIAQMMLREYGGKDTKHWFYNTQNVYHPMYFHIWGQYVKEEEFHNLSIDEQEKQVQTQIDRLKTDLKEQEFLLLQISNKRQFMLDSDEFKLSEALSNVRLKRKLNTELLTGEYENRIINESLKEIKKYDASKEVYYNEKTNEKNEQSINKTSTEFIKDRERTSNSTSDNIKFSRKITMAKEIKDVIPKKDETKRIVKSNARTNKFKRNNSQRKTKR